MAAPSASNIKPWHFIVIRDPERLKALADLHRHGKMLSRASLAVAVCGVPAESRYWVQDCSAATENLLLAATALGLGAVWLGVHPRPEREGPIGEALGVPEGVGVLCLIAIGNPDQEKPARTQYDPARVHSEQF
jgi:nitroreductase